MALLPTTLEGTTTRERATPRRRIGTQNVLAMAVLFVATVYVLVPVYWLVINATKSSNDIIDSFGLWFSSWNLGANLHDLFTTQNGIYVRWLVNTAIYAFGSAILGTLFSAMAGYALAKYIFPGRNLIFSIILSALLVPATALALPLFLLLSKAGLTNTIWSVLLPQIASPFGVYLARIYAAASVPDDLLDAARVDGLGEFRTFFTVATRIMAPALVTVFLFQFVAVWNNYFLPLIMLQDPSLYPLTLGLQTLNATSGNSQQLQYNLVVAGALISVIPLIVAFLLLQRYWRSGLTAGGVKG